MLRAKIKDILKEMPLHEDFYCYQVPQEYHFWTNKNKWQSMLAKGMEPVRIKVHGVKDDLQNEVLKYSNANPLVVCGVSIRGQESSNQGKTYVWDFRTSTVETINEVLTDLCKNNGVSVVKVNELEVRNLDTNVILKCEVFNPNGKEASLYIVGFLEGNQLIFYPKMNLADMMRYVSKFKGDVAKCCVAPTIGPGCVIEQHIKTSQIKRIAKGNKR